jgi:hypothetical protein
VDIVVAMVAFFALAASWFVLPSSPRTSAVASQSQQPVTAETLAPAA